MKVKTTEMITEIEATAEELRQSNTVSEAMLRYMRNAFSPRTAPVQFDFNNDEEDTEE